MAEQPDAAADLCALANQLRARLQSGGLDGLDPIAFDDGDIRLDAKVAVRIVLADAEHCLMLIRRGRPLLPDRLEAVVADLRRVLHAVDQR